MSMQEELRWFASFPKELKVIASGDNAIDVLENAQEKYPDKRIVLAFVPKEETLILPVG